ncbi:alpha/beta hydrolase [Autumnicola musiva]|uniref:Alpha/beta hydrolase n=1 Tax=Autumnicola musiva TaxID=3075589 RepID=A0ABU3DB50_9FLAO|nr:alpha/beta hydrolase [Zunongwangia sp. F117]MDT0678766.1 alpha/beta hydrolase [Zunongwangia sp. F117]
MSQEARPFVGEKDPHVFKEVRSFLETLNSGDGKPMEQMTPEEARQVLVGAQKSVEVDYSGIEETEQQISQNGYDVNLHITKPKNAIKGLPVFIFIHGGGWVLGDYPTHRRLVRDLVVESGAVAVFPDYTPSPEAKYPTAINEIYAATQWVSENGENIGVDGNNLAVVGNSVGGNMAAVIALMAKENNGPKLKLQVLLWPVTDANLETESYNLFAEGRFLTKNMMKWFWDNYLPDTTKRNENYASPLQASLEELNGLPPALVQTAENDVLRDEGEAYARKLNEAGVKVTLTRYGGLIHDYGLLNPIADITAIQVALLQAAVIIKESLR